MRVDEGGVEMDVKQYLSRYHYLELDIKHMQDEIKEYKTKHSLLLSPLQLFQILSFWLKETQ